MPVTVSNTNLHNHKINCLCCKRAVSGILHEHKINYLYCKWIINEIQAHFMTYGPNKYCKPELPLAFCWCFFWLQREVNTTPGLFTIVAPLTLKLSRGQEWPGGFAVGHGTWTTSFTWGSMKWNYQWNRDKEVAFYIEHV